MKIVAYHKRFLQYSLLAFSAIATVFLLVGAGLNNHGLKYHRALPADGCHRRLLILSVEDSEHCCDDIRSSDWVCVATHDPIGKFFVSWWAFLLPLAPTCLTIISERFFSEKFEARRLAGGIARVGMCLVIVLFRTVRKDLSTSFLF